MMIVSRIEDMLNVQAWLVAKLKLGTVSKWGRIGQLPTISKILISFDLQTTCMYTMTSPLQGVSSTFLELSIYAWISAAAIKMGKLHNFPTSMENSNIITMQRTVANR